MFGFTAEPLASLVHDSVRHEHFPLWIRIIAARSYPTYAASDSGDTRLCFESSAISMAKLSPLKKEAFSSTARTGAYRPLKNTCL
jgi:hypothetical protein